MTPERIVAWNMQMQAVHHRLEEALRVARGAAGRPGNTDPLSHCYGFCAALTAHHTGEDTALFPLLLAKHPELAPVISRLVDEHQVLADLVAQFEDVLGRLGAGSEEPKDLESRLDQIQAAMTAHFAYEERELDQALDDLRDPLLQVNLE